MQKPVDQLKCLQVQKGDNVIVQKNFFFQTLLEIGNEKND